MEAGHDVCVIPLFGGGPLTQVLRECGVPIVFPNQIEDGRRNRPRFLIGLEVAANLGLHWRMRRPDAMQAWLIHAQVIAIPVAAVLRIPIRAIALRNLSTSVRQFPMRAVSQYVVSRLSTVALSNSSAALSDEGWCLGDLPRAVVGNGVTLPNQLASPGDAPCRGVMIANLRAHKGHLDLLHALTRLDNCPEMDLIGSGVMENEVISAISQLGLTNRVRLLRGVSNASSILDDYSFSVLPSYFEGIPNSLLESMAAGLPVVATRVGGVPEIVEDGVTGLLVPPGDTEALARAIALLTTDPSLRASMGRAGREAAAQHSWQEVAKRNLAAMHDSKELSSRG